MTLYQLHHISPDIDALAWVADTACVIGRVVLEARTSVWFGATLRGDNEPIVVGDGTNIQENAILHTDMGFPCTIGKNCTVGHRAIVHGCTIGDESLIGMGATVMNGARVGVQCLIGAHALITEGQTIEDHTLVLGAPAKSVRKLTDQECTRLVQSAHMYQDKAILFKRNLKPIG